MRIQPQALHLLKGYGWPGNVRELEHAIHRGAVLARAEQRSSVLTLATHHFSIAIPPMPQSGISPTENIDDFATNQMGLRASTDAFQSALITKVLADHNDNWAATARALNIDCGNLHRLAKRLGLK